MPTPAKKPSAPKKSSPSAGASSKSNYRVRVSKNYESYVDMYRESRNTLLESGGNFSLKELKELKNEEAIWEILCNWNPDAELDQAEYLCYFGLSISVMDYGICGK